MKTKRMTILIASMILLTGLALADETPDQPQPVVTEATEEASETDASAKSTEAGQPPTVLESPTQPQSRDDSTSLPDFCAIRAYFLFLLPACES